MQNWAKNYTYLARQIESPATIDEVIAIVAREPKIRALGSRHCFNDIADSPGVLISTQKLNRILSIDRAAQTVTIEPGVTYGQLGPYLHAAGFALANLASLPHITIAGSCATGTHGSGESNGCLSTSVAAMELVTADGSTRSIRRGDADFNGAVVHLGALGVVTQLTLDVVPTFDIEQFVYERVPVRAFIDRMDEIAASAYSVSGFTDWQAGNFTQVWVKRIAGRSHFDLTEIGGTPAPRQRHPLEGRKGNVASEGSGADACTQQMGVPGPWHERLPHFRMEFTPSSGEELQSEYFVAREYAADALEAISNLRDAIDPLLQISEVRFIAADDLWMSMCHGRASVSIHFTWRKESAGVIALLPRIEAALAPFHARSHWGKIFTMPKETLTKRYQNVNEFRSLAARFDPTGKYRNAFAERTFS